jgi:hypothetical protein
MKVGGMTDIGWKSSGDDASSVGNAQETGDAREQDDIDNWTENQHP